MQEGQPQNGCIWKITIISRRTEVNVDFKPRGNVQFFLLPCNLAFFNEGAMTVIGFICVRI